MPTPATAHLPHTPSDAPLPRLYRPEEIAEALGCSAWWVKDRARRSLIPHTRVGRAYRFTAGHLAAIIRLHEETPVRPAQPAGNVAAPSSTTASRDGSPQPRRHPTAPANRLRARPPRRAQYSATA
ncbi:helix-turn-helix domain-containing protein [Streptomyces megasporus]|uniref:helix-turn-helix domain-containing protein n=1 Tax=Streptomyces megasporus TaxID=44060 RepID=UPI000997FE72|nr:helix-turn-helix domain-containing protein [Streptomyces megasporus]